MANLGPTTINGDMTVKGDLGGAFRIGHCKDNAGAGSDIDVYLDTYSTGDIVNVSCAIADGDNLNTAFPRLSSTNQMVVARITGNAWVSLTTFATKISSSSSSSISSASSGSSSSSSSISSSSSSSESSSSSSGMCISDGNTFVEDSWSDIVGPPWNPTVNGGTFTASGGIASLTTSNAAAQYYVKLDRNDETSANIGGGAGFVLSLRFNPISLAHIVGASQASDLYISFTWTSGQWLGISWAETSSGSGVYGIYRWDSGTTNVRIGTHTFSLNTWQTWTLDLHNNYDDLDIWQDGSLIEQDYDVSAHTTASGESDGDLIIEVFGYNNASDVDIDWVRFGDYCL